MDDLMQFESKKTDASQKWLKYFPQLTHAKHADAERVLWFFYFAISIALILTGFGAASGGHASGITAVMWAVGCLAAGTCIGFLFGIPRILQMPDDLNADSAKDNQAGLSDRSYRQQVNTNLTEISDWLTKIIVGLGLIHLTQIPGFVAKAASVLATSLASFDSDGNYGGLAVAIMVAFPALGFLFGYLSTRLYLAGAFARADRESIHATREIANAASGSAESLNESLAVLTSKLNQAIGLESTNVNVASSDLLGFSKADQDQAVGDAILRLADDYEKFQAESKQERIQVRNRISNEMAGLICGRPAMRDFLEERIESSPNDGLISGLATAINADPAIEDLPRLLKIGIKARKKHTRYKVATALGRLFDARLAGVQDVASSLKMLSMYYRDEADDALRRRIQQTFAQISQSTGVGVSRTPS